MIIKNCYYILRPLAKGKHYCPSQIKPKFKAATAMLVE